MRMLIMFFILVCSLSASHFRIEKNGHLTGYISQEVREEVLNGKGCLLYLTTVEEQLGTRTKKKIFYEYVDENMKPVGFMCKIEDEKTDIIEGKIENELITLTFNKKYEKKIPVQGRFYFLHTFPHVRKKRLLKNMYGDDVRVFDERNLNIRVIKENKIGRMVLSTANGPEISDLFLWDLGKGTREKIAVFIDESMKIKLMLSFDIQERISETAGKGTGLFDRSCKVDRFHLIHPSVEKLEIAVLNNDFLSHIPTMKLAIRNAEKSGRAVIRSERYTEDLNGFDCSEFTLPDILKGFVKNGKEEIFPGILLFFRTMESENSKGRNPETLLKERKGSGSDVSRAFTYLLNNCGFRARDVLGFSYHAGEYHFRNWTQVVRDGQWKDVDINSFEKPYEFYFPIWVGDLSAWQEQEISEKVSAWFTNAVIQEHLYISGGELTEFRKKEPIHHRIGDYFISEQFGFFFKLPHQRLRVKSLGDRSLEMNLRFEDKSLRVSLQVLPTGFFSNIRDLHDFRKKKIMEQNESIKIVNSEFILRKPERMTWTYFTDSKDYESRVKEAYIIGRSYHYMLYMSSKGMKVDEAEAYFDSLFRNFREID